MATVTVTANGVTADDVVLVARSPLSATNQPLRSPLSATNQPLRSPLPATNQPLQPAVRVRIGADAVAAMERSRTIVDDIERTGRPVYGVSTGFGALAQTSIEPARRVELQHALIRSHASGLGAPMPAEVVRAMMLLRVRSLALGRSGVRPVVASALVGLLNAGVVPWVPEHGSLGASGDLAPLAHCALVLTGEGWVLGPAGERLPAPDALRAAGLAPLTLAAKEGLALINGTDGMLGMLLLAVADARHLFTMADITCALAIEAMLGSDRPFQRELHEIRPHPGQAVSAANIYRLLQNSEVMASHRDDFEHAVQDAYAMRCASQVAGAARDTLDFASTVAGRELVSVVDNPVVLPDGRVESTGNFHGAPLGFAADFLAIAAAEVGSISERRVDRLLDVTRNRDLPAFLSPDPGVNSGLMIAQYTAAGIVAENRRLAAPASVDSLPTSGMQEDHVSMGWAATVKLRRVLDNLRSLLAVELLAAVRGLQLRRPLRPSPAGQAAMAVVGRVAGEPGPDVFLAPVVEACRDLVAAPDLRAAIEEAAGELG